MEKVQLCIGGYLLKETIGKGTFGKVKIGIHMGTGKMVAVKMVSRERMKDLDVVAKMRQEIHLQRIFRHPHIVRLFRAFSTPSDIFLITEYMEGGDLLRFMQRHGPLAESVARPFYQQLLSGLDYCHRHMVVHRDIKPEVTQLICVRSNPTVKFENLLLDAPQKNIKLADFGMATLMSDGGFLDTSCGSPNYASPEILSGKSVVRRRPSEDERRVLRLYAGPEVDVWSSGVVLFAMCAGRLPFVHEERPALFHLIRTATYVVPNKFSTGLRFLIGRILTADPELRCTISDILSYDWFNTSPPSNYLFPNPTNNFGSNASVCEATEQSDSSAKDLLWSTKEEATHGGPSHRTTHEIRADSVSDPSAEEEAGPSQMPEATRVPLITRLSSESPAWCGPKCEHCPSWPGVASGVFDSFIPVLGHCDTCSRLGGRGCLFKASEHHHCHPPPPETVNLCVEDIGQFLLGLTLSKKTHPEYMSERPQKFQSGKGPLRRIPQWRLGLHSASSPVDIMLELYRVLKAVGLEWQCWGAFSLQARRVGADESHMSICIDLFQLDGPKCAFLLDFRSHAPSEDKSLSDEDMDWEEWNGGHGNALQMSTNVIEKPETPQISSKSEALVFFELCAAIIQGLMGTNN